MAPNFLQSVSSAPAVFVVASLFALLAAHPASATGDAATEAELSRLLLPIAQCAIAESGGHTQDVIAIVWVLAKRAEQAGISVGQMARKYCRIHRDAGRGISRVRPHRRWILELNWAAPHRRPPSWPGGRWSVMAERWVRVTRLTLLVAAGELDDPCPRAFHWGSDADGQPARTGPVSCGATRNRFWSRPGRAI